MVQDAQLSKEQAQSCSVLLYWESLIRTSPPFQSKTGELLATCINLWFRDMSWFSWSPYCFSSLHSHGLKAWSTKLRRQSLVSEWHVFQSKRSSSCPTKLRCRVVVFLLNVSAQRKYRARSEGFTKNGLQRANNNRCLGARARKCAARSLH